MFSLLAMKGKRNIIKHALRFWELLSLFDDIFLTYFKGKICVQVATYIHIMHELKKRVV